MCTIDNISQIPVLPADFQPIGGIYNGVENGNSLSPEQIADVYLGRKFFFIDKNSQNFGITSEFNEANITDVSSVFVKKIMECRDRNSHIPRALKEKRIELASLYLKAMILRYSTLIDQGYKACKKNPLAMSIAKLDRYLASEKFFSMQPVRKEGEPVARTPLSLEEVQRLFSTKIAKEMVAKWGEFKTHAGMKYPTNGPADKLIQSDYVYDAFLRHPLEVDYIKSRANHDGYLHSKAARFNEPIFVSRDGYHFKMRFNRHYQKVCDIRSQSKGSKLVYRKGFGLIAENSTAAQPLLPVFKPRKEGKSPDDYRVVVKSLINGETKHTWLEIKDPLNTYSIGYSFKVGEKISPYFRLSSVKGEVVTPDRCEFLFMDDKVVKTVISISRDQFDTLKTHFEEMIKKETHTYNVVSSNCTSFVRKSLKQINIDLPSRDSGVGVMLGYYNPYKIDSHSISHKIISSVYRISCIFIRNPLMFLFGGARLAKDEFGMSVGTAVFNSIHDLFTPEAGEFDDPYKVQKWQQNVAQKREEELERLTSSENFALLSEEEKQVQINRIRYTLPLIDSLD